MKKIKILKDPDALAAETTAMFFKIAHQAVLDKGICSVALAGGSTPKATYQKIADIVASKDSSVIKENSQGIGNQDERGDHEASNSWEAIPANLDWTKIHFFWGDERCVPPDHPDSNYNMAWHTLLSQIPVPYENLHRMAGELDPDLAAKKYQDEMGIFFGSQPRFDLILLGMGTDGHTASIFPGSSAITNIESWVVANYVQSMDTWRLTFTPGIINQARNIIFVVSGKSKAGVIREVFKGEYNPGLLPSQIVNPTDGNLYWFIDKEAGILLTRSPDPQN